MKRSLFGLLLLSAITPCILHADDTATEYANELQFVQPDHYFKNFESENSKYFEEFSILYAKELLLVDLIESASDPIEKTAYKTQLKADLLFVLNICALETKKLEGKLLKAQEKLVKAELKEQEKLARRENKQTEEEEEKEELVETVSKIIYEIEEGDWQEPKLTKVEKQHKKIARKKEKLDAMKHFTDTLSALFKYTR